MLAVETGKARNTNEAATERVLLFGRVERHVKQLLGGQRVPFAQRAAQVLQGPPQKKNKNSRLGPDLVHG